MRIRGSLPRHPVLHPDKAVPAAQRELPPAGLCLAQVDEPVDGDRVVAGTDDRPTVGHQTEQAGPEGLVVVDDVVSSLRPHRRSLTLKLNVRGSGKPPVSMVASSTKSGQERILAEVREAKRVRLPVEVEAWDLDQPDPCGLVQGRPGLAREHRHLVAEPRQLPGKEPGVDTLAARSGVAPIDQERHPQMLALGGRGLSQMTRPSGAFMPEDMWGPALPPGDSWSSWASKRRYSGGQAAQQAQGPERPVLHELPRAQGGAVDVVRDLAAVLRVGEHVMYGERAARGHLRGPAPEVLPGHLLAVATVDEQQRQGRLPRASHRGRLPHDQDDVTFKAGVDQRGRAHGKVSVMPVAWSTTSGS